MRSDATLVRFLPFCFLVFIGCGDKPVREETPSFLEEAPHPSVTTDKASEASNASEGPPHLLGSASTYSAKELVEELGIRFKVVDEFHLGCKGNRCVCFVPLPCEKTNNCFPLKENLEGFRAALSPPKGIDRSVVCKNGEVTSCGDFELFNFEGDIHRYEQRTFRKSGDLVAQRNWTDYPEYCRGKALTRWQGQVAKCASSKSVELLCGEKQKTPRTPLEDLKSYLRNPLDGYVVSPAK